MDKENEFKDTSSNCHTVKLTVDIDRWQTKFASRDTIPTAYYLLHPKERRIFEKENAITPLSWMNGSGWGQINRIDILKSDLPVHFPTIDYGDYSWGSKNLHFIAERDCEIPLRIITEKDTFYSSIRVEGDTLIMENTCNAKRKQKKSIYISPLGWPDMIITAIKRHKIEKDKK